MKKEKSGSTDVVVAEVMPEVSRYETPVSTDAAERIKFHLSHARVATVIALRHIIEAGWELAKQKQILGYGQWGKFCEEKIGISRLTASRYIATFQQTVGEMRAAQSVGLEAKILQKEIDAAMEGMEDKTVRQAMIDLGVVKPSANWGGTGRGQGRKPRGSAGGEAAEVDTIAQNPALLFAAIKGPLDELWRLYRERDVFAHLGDKELADAAAVLGDLARAAADALAMR